MEIPLVRKAIEKVEKELDGKGRILVRYSGTENKARVMVEAEKEEQLKLTDEVAKVIEMELGK